MKPYILLVTFVFLASCGGVTEENESLSDLKESVTNSADGPLVLSDVFGFQWEKVYLFGPYTPVIEIRKAVNSEEIDANRIDRRDDICLLVFVESRNRMRSVAVPRSICDFSKVESFTGLNRDDASFSVFCKDGFCVAGISAPQTDQ